MDALLAEINKKKADLAAANGANGNGDAGPSTTKYMKRAEVEAAQEEAKRIKREQAKETLRREKEEREAKRLGLKRTATSTVSTKGTPEPSSDSQAAPASASTASTLPPAEISRRLRSRGRPIRFFGETDKDRFARLRALELADGDGRMTGGRVDEFRSMLKGVEEEMLLKDSERAGKKRRVEGAALGAEQVLAEGGGAERGAEGTDKQQGKGQEGGTVQGYTGLIDLGLLKTDISKLHPQVYWFWKNLLKEWEAWLEDRPDDVKRSMEGKLASANWIQSSTNMKPLFKQLRNRTVPLDVLAKLGEIALESQHRQYQKANDAYLRLSIGNAAWPIGVTSVGMHERGARERIATDVVAHVLNDEISRKWIQAVKRLLTFAQMVRPPKEHAHRMG